MCLLLVLQRSTQNMQVGFQKYTDDCMCAENSKLTAYKKTIFVQTYATDANFAAVFIFYAP